MKQKIINPVPESHLRRVKWLDVRAVVKKVNPDLAEIIDDLNPDIDLTVGKYTYGAIIASGAAKQKFPNFLVLHNSCEFFWEYRERPITSRVIKASEIAIGQFDSNLQDNALWKLSSGGQNVFMPAKISDYDRHKKLQTHFGFEVNRPLQFQDQVQVFNLIANSHRVSEKWHCEILFFTDEWLLKYQHDPDWLPFYNYLLQQTLDQKTKQTAHIETFNLISSILQYEKSIKLNVNQIEAVMQLFMLALNEIPGFMVLQNENLAPLKLLQHTYLEHYKLRQYEPLIMGPGYLDETDQHSEAIYFAMNYRNFCQFAPPENKFASNAKEFYQVKWAFEKIVDFIKTKDYLAPEHAICQALNNVDFTFYHPGTEMYEDFIPTEEIPLYDKAFAASLEKGFQFPARSSFFNGCVQLRRLSLTDPPSTLANIP